MRTDIRREMDRVVQRVLPDPVLREKVLGIYQQNPILRELMKMAAGTTERDQTYGEKAVGLTFNPSGDETVRQLKEAYAEIIDLCHGARENTTDPEAKRLWSIAITEAQTAQMWAVKAQTWRT